MKSQHLVCTDIRRIELREFELPRVPDHGILAQNDYTAISVGTEIYTYAHGGEPSRPSAFPRTTGYCNTGVVLEIGKDVKGIKPGDRIAGQGNHAHHAVLTQNFFKVPAGVSPKSAAFMVMCAIALHGHRVGRPELGEAVAITGMGIVGQLAATFAPLGRRTPGHCHRHKRLSVGQSPYPGRRCLPQSPGRSRCRTSRARTLHSRRRGSGH